MVLIFRRDARRLDSNCFDIEDIHYSSNMRQWFDLSLVIAQSRDRTASHYVGSENRGRAATRARGCPLLTGMACEHCGRGRITNQMNQMNPNQISERGRPCPTLRDTLDVRLHNYAVGPEYPEQPADVRTCVTSTA